jgi:prolyl-tRNA editing enzyme YbaK/EbsC (Cys-tRNA(Pro) deacylase)
VDDAGTLHRNAARVQQALRDAGSSARVVQDPQSARTAEEAAQRLGCEVGAIVKSLLFLADGAPLLVLTSGAHRVDTVFLGAALGAELTRADADAVRLATGQPIGGVAPLGHPSRLRTIVDETLAGFPVVWAAAGTPHALFATSFTELLALTGGEAAAVRPAAG